MGEEFQGDGLIKRIFVCELEGHFGCGYLDFSVMRRREFESCTSQQMFVQK